jgi:hypothetical protein
MSLHHTLRLYKGCAKDDFCVYLDKAAHRLGGEIQWNVEGAGEQDFRLDSNQNVHSVYVPYQRNEFVFCRTVGELSELPWIELRIQEGSASYRLESDD